jgi:hypothetical protein
MNFKKWFSSIKDKAYFKEFNRSLFFKHFLIFIILYFTREFFYKGVNKFIIGPIGIDQIRRTSDLDILAILILLLTFGRLIQLLFLKKLIPSLNSLLNIILATVFYYKVIRFPHVFSFIELKNFSFIKYLDVFFFLSVLLLTKFRFYPFSPYTGSKNGFIEDNFQPNVTRDILGREKYANQLGRKILATSTLEKAFVIAISSPWGFGKSGFLILLEESLYKGQLSTKSDKNIIPSRTDNLRKKSPFSKKTNTLIVKYNPWKNFDDKKVVQDFFDELSLSINTLDTQLSKQIRNYSNYLYKLDESVFSKFIESSVDSLTDDKTLSNLFEEINNTISRIQKRIVVFVDDLDRLTGDELIDILKLIRNTANFRNTVFVVAYDHNYVLNTIDKKNLISNKEEYLQKIVQLEITLPSFSKNILIDFLNERINNWEISIVDSDKIKSAINEIFSISIVDLPKPGSSQTNPNALADFIFRSNRTEDSLLFQVFQNVRDIIRFVNSFNLSFESIGQVADLYEIILLELLKIRYLTIFQIISNKRFLIINKEQYEFSYDDFDTFMNFETAKSLNVRWSDAYVIRAILSNLFNPKRKIYFRSVKYPRYFDIYFTYQAPNLIKLEEIEKVLKEKSIIQVAKVIDQSVKDGSYDDLRNFLDSQTEFTKKEDFEIILQSLFYAAKYDNRN